MDQKFDVEIGFYSLIEPANCTCHKGKLVQSVVAQVPMEGGGFAEYLIGRAYHDDEKAVLKNKNTFAVEAMREFARTQGLDEREIKSFRGAEAEKAQADFKRNNDQSLN